MDGEPMKKKPLGMLLQESLDAAFSGQVFFGPEEIAGWGRKVIDFLQEGLPGQERLQEILWGLARRIIQDRMQEDQSLEILIHILNNPDAFFRSLLLVYFGELPLATPTGWRPPRLH